MPSLQGSQRNASMAQASTRFNPVFNVADQDSATETVVQSRVKTAGTYSKMYVRIASNTVSATSTLRFRKGAANGNQTFTIAAGASGEFEDGSNSDAVVANDLIDVSVAVGAGGTSIGLPFQLTMVFTATSGESQTHATTAAASTVSAASTTTFMYIVGPTNITSTTESDNAFRIRANGTFGLSRWNVTTNGRSTNTVIRSRNNGANGNVVITVAGGTTGNQEDGSNTDTVTPGNTYNWSLTTGTGVGNFSVQNTATDFIPTTTEYMTFQGQTVTATTIAAGATKYAGFWGGRQDLAGTEAQTQVKMRESDTLSYMATNVSANTIVGDGTYRIRINGAYGNQTISLTGLTTGYFEDGSHTDNVVSGDEVTSEIVGGAAGTSMTLRYLGLMIAPTATPSTTVSGLLMFFQSF